MPKSKHHQRFEFESLSIDHTSEEPLFRQLEKQLRSAIWDGYLRTNERLPSSRRLALQLNIARNTVINAYEQLITEGFLFSQRGSGTRVAQNFLQATSTSKKYNKNSVAQVPPFTPSTRFNEAISCFKYKQQADSPKPFTPHTPAYREFPHKQWAQLMGKCLRQTEQDWIEETNSSGHYPLRQAISAYLGSARMIKADANEIMITAGVQQAIELLAKLLIEPGDTVCFEDPAYMPAVAIFKMLGANIKFIPTDEQGLDVAYLRNSVKHAKLIYTTPSNQFPLGTTLSQTRRHELLEWAGHSGAIILEDDYNGEYRYHGRPLTTLYTMAPANTVIYLGSFSKLLFPSLRLGYMVVPKTMMQPLAQLRWLLDRHSPPLEQIVLTDFINEGHFARHLRRMRTLYAERQQHLIKLVEQHLANYMTMPLLEGGLHLIAYLNNDLSESDFLKACTQAKINTSPVSQFCVDKTQHKGIIFGYAPYTKSAMTYAIKKLQKELNKL